MMFARFLFFLLAAIDSPQLGMNTLTHFICRECGAHLTACISMINGTYAQLETFMILALFVGFSVIRY
jgi:hypothetical protein